MQLAKTNERVCNHLLFRSTYSFLIPICKITSKIFSMAAKFVQHFLLAWP